MLFKDISQKKERERQRYVVKGNDQTKIIENSLGFKMDKIYKNEIIIRFIIFLLHIDYK